MIYFINSETAESGARFPLQSWAGSTENHKNNPKKALPTARCLKRNDASCWGRRALFVLSSNHEHTDFSSFLFFIVVRVQLSPPALHEHRFQMV